MASQRDGGIPWCDETWNPVRGCSRVSEGCRNCYAERTAIRHVWTGIKSDLAVPDRKPGPYHGLVKSTPAGPHWTGEVRFVEEALILPLRWRQPRRIFVNSMSDLFHERVEDEWIDRIFAVMALTQRHTYQVLTKRPQRMLAYLTDSHHQQHVVNWMDRLLGPKAFAGEAGTDNGVSDFPCPAIWLGVSVEDQATADERIPPLLQTPAAVRWVSYEPALAAVDFAPWLRPRCQGCGDYRGRGEDSHTIVTRTGLREYPEQGYPCGPVDPALDWIVVGGESGPGARPPHPDWFRSARDQCAAAGVPFFFKQWGEYAPVLQREGGPGRMVRAGDVVVTLDVRRAAIEPRTLTCALEGQGIPMRRHGKKAAGALLDGREWLEYPK